MCSYVINKKGLLVLLLIFCFMYVLNSFTPLLNEDYFGAFVWPEGVPNLGILPKDVRRVSNLSDVLENLRVYYLTEGGRLPGGFIIGVLFWNLEKTYFNLFNAMIMTVLVMEIYWLSHEGIVTFNFDSSYLFWIFFGLWAFNASFVDACLWASGSSNYLLMMVVVLAFLIPYVRNYYEEEWLQKDDFKITTGMFFAGILAGWSHETTICWLIVFLFYWLYLCKKNKRLQNWKIAGFIGLCVGYLLLICAPGNFYRLSQQAQLSGGIPINELYLSKLTELVWIFLFHFLLFYFITKSLFKAKKNCINNLKFAPYMNIAEICSLVAIGSGIVMFLIPVSGWRPSFLNLVFLVTAAASLYRGQEVANIFVFNNRGQRFLKFVGCSYFLMTVFVSLWCSYINWNHWNEVLEMIYREQMHPTNIVLKVKPYYTDNKAWLHFCSGLHLIYMPVVSNDENDRINIAVARYYNIKGIAKMDW